MFSDSRWFIQYWNFYDWLGVASLLVIIAMILGAVALGVDAGKRFIDYLK